MQKIFKIERVDNHSEFKQKKAEYKRKGRARNSRKHKSTVQEAHLEQLIAKQAKLHNEEKEMVEQQEKVATIQQLTVSEEEAGDTNLQMLKSESVISFDQETRDTIPAPVVTSIDAAILEGLEFIGNATMIRQAQQDFQLMKQQILPAKMAASPEYTLVLDLDETLVHCKYDEVKECIYISYRPYLNEFLEKVSQLFEVVVFTASEEEYASMVLDRIDPEKKYIHHRLFRDSCMPLNGNYIKDLSVLGRDLNKTIIIDNSIIAFSLNLDNGIPIHAFCGDKHDTELYKLIEVVDYAMSLNQKAAPECSNVRQYLTSIFGLKERIRFWQAHCLANAQRDTEIEPTPQVTCDR